MPQRHHRKPDDILTERTKRSTLPAVQPTQTVISPPGLTKIRTLDDDYTTDGPDFGKITVVRYSSVPNEQSKPKRPSYEEFKVMPFAYRHGRRFLRDPSLSYPLPVDLIELHRQSLRTLLLSQIFGGRPFCAPFFRELAPKRVLEVACGSALWSSIAHDFFKDAGYDDVSFTGLDIAPLASNHQKQGLNWRFVQHDLRKWPLPFEEEEFDFIFVKDTIFCAAGANMQPRLLTKLMKYLKPSGVIEVWESDLLLRSLLFVAIFRSCILCHCKHRLIAPGTPFAKAQNKYIQDYNDWASEAIDELGFTAAPCAVMGLTFSSDPDLYKNVGSRRVAVPLSPIRWEREESGDSSAPSKSTGRERRSSKALPKSDAFTTYRNLTTGQAALRRTALITVLGLIEGLEPMLLRQSGKTRDEWDRWWTGLNSDVLENDGLLSGECLEIGAWWAQKT